MGYLKLNFKGKLRLTMDRENKDRKINIKSAMEAPINTFGVIEDEDLYIKFDKPVYIKSLYLRLHKSEVNEYKDEKMFIIGYKNNMEVFGSKISSHSYKWVRILFKLNLFFFKILVHCSIQTNSNRYAENSKRIRYRQHPYPT